MDKPVDGAEALAVTQADRDAAAQMYQWFPAMSSSVDAAQKTAQFIRDGGGDGWNSVHLMRDLRLAGVKEGLEMAAMCAEAYSAVNFETAGDSVLLDPVLRGHGFSPENMAASEKHQIDGLVHSSYAHAGQHLAASIRSLGPRP